MIHSGPLVTWKQMKELEVGDVFAVVWTNRMPLAAAARTGKKHYVSADSFPMTLCGRLVPRPSKQFVPRAEDPVCARCERKRTA